MPSSRDREDGSGSWGPGRDWRFGVQQLQGVGVYVLDEAGRVAAINQRAETLLARPAEEVIGEDGHDLLHRGSSGQMLARSRCPLLRAFFADRSAQGTAWYERGDGALLTVSWLFAPCKDADATRGALVFFHEADPRGVDAAGTAAGAGAPYSASSPDLLSELDRLALLAETTTQLTATLDADETLRRLTRLVVPRLADWAVVDLITESDELRRAAVVHFDGHSVVSRPDLQGPMPPIPQESPMPLSRALRGAASTLAGPEVYHGPPDTGIAVVQRELFEITGMHSAAITPIRGVREVLGALTLGRSARPGAFQDLALLEDIARRAGLALDNARLYQGQRRVAETMQRHLLPQMPDVPRMRMAARYEPATDAAQVGGDWYDVFKLPDGATALAIGDVVGHDLDAAAGMAQARNMLRAYAWSYREPPSLIVDRLDDVVEHMTEAAMATMIFARLEEQNGSWLVTWTNAGHPSPLLVTHDGRARYLGGDPDPLIGTGVRQQRGDVVEVLPPRSTLFLYTDGLIESPHRSLDDGLQRLRRNAAALARRPLDAFCDLLLERVRPDDNEDDVALLALRPPGTV